MCQRGGLGRQYNDTITKRIIPFYISIKSISIELYSKKEHPYQLRYSIPTRQDNSAYSEVPVWLVEPASMSLVCQIDRPKSARYHWCLAAECLSNTCQPFDQYVRRVGLYAIDF